jgi:hypothetical protein
VAGVIGRATEQARGRLHAGPFLSANRYRDLNIFRVADGPLDIDLSLSSTLSRSLSASRLRSLSMTGSGPNRLSRHGSVTLPYIFFTVAR